jgi:serine/threonine-protein kinase
MSTKNVGRSTDIWALGVILYESITGVSPFLREKMAQMCNAVLGDEVEPLSQHLSDAPPGLEEVIARCLMKKPADRFRNVGEVAGELAPFATEAGATLARRIARKVAQGVAPVPSSPGSGDSPHPSSGPCSPIPASDPLDATAGPSSDPVSAPAGVVVSIRQLPRLGIVSAAGTVDSWRDILQEPRPAPRRGPVALGAALLAAALTLLGLVWVSTGPEAPAGPANESDR